jgi:hypothetical protein
MIFGDLAYLTAGFGATFLALEAAWYFRACTLSDRTVKLFYINKLTWLLNNPSIVED